MKRKGPLSLKSNLILFSAGLITLTLLSGVLISFRIYEKSMVQKTAESRVDVLMQISERVTALGAGAELLSNLYFYNERLTEFYREEGYRQQEIEAIQDHFQNIEEISSMTSAVLDMDFYYSFIMENGYTYCSNGSSKAEKLDHYRNKIWFSQVERGEQKWISTYEDTKGKNVLSIARPLKDREENLIGLYLFNIYEESLSKTFEGVVDHNDLYIVDGQGNIVSHTDKDLLGIHFYDMEVLNQMFQDSNYQIIEKNQKEYLFSIYRNEKLDWILVEEIPMELLLQDVNAIKGKLFLAGLGIFLGAMGISVYIAQKTIHPLRELLGQLEKIGRSEEGGEAFQAEGWREIHTICQECNYMNDRIRKLVKTIKESEKKKRTAEIGFLQSQMSPHFIYNTLFSIRCLVDMGEKEKAVAIIDAFTSILKYILSYKEEFVTVSGEIKFLEDYRVLQKHRYGDGFQLTIICDRELYGLRILRMILEPLVENSLFHGLDSEKEEIHVEVRFQLEDGDLLITVTDDGVGFTDEHFQRMSERLKSGGQSNLIGMNNIRERLKMTFGKKYGISVDINYEGGARVIVKVPVIE